MIEKNIFDNSKLIGKIIEVFGSRKALAVFLGYKPNTFCGLLRNPQRMNMYHIMLIAKACHIEINEIPEYFFRYKGE